jgi:hypothetical protein
MGVWILLTSGILMGAALLLSWEGTIRLLCSPFDFEDDAPDLTFRHHLSLVLGALASCVFWVSGFAFIYELK